MTTRTTLPVGSLSRRQLLTVLVATPLVASFLAACGSDQPEASGSDSSGATPDPTTPTADGLSFPTGADEVVVRIDQGVGGFTTPQWAFAQIPSLVLTGDGRVVMPGPQIEIYPAPMLPALQSTTVTSARIGDLLAEADRLGLLATPPDYDTTRPPLEDAGSTVVTLNANGETYVHRAFALGTAAEQTDDARKRLAEFVEFAMASIGDAAGNSSTIFEPDEYVLSTMVVNTADYTGDIAPTVVPWPETFGDAPVGEACITVDAATVHTELESANQLTFFDVTVGEPAVPTVAELLLRPVLPGSDRC